MELSDSLSVFQMFARLSLVCDGELIVSKLILDKKASASLARSDMPHIVPVGLLFRCRRKLGRRHDYPQIRLKGFTVGQYSSIRRIKANLENTSSNSLITRQCAPKIIMSMSVGQTSCYGKAVRETKARKDPVQRVLWPVSSEPKLTCRQPRCLSSLFRNVQ